MAILQVGDKYEVVYQNGKFVIIDTDSAAMAASTIVHYGVNPVSEASAALTGTVISGGVLESEIVSGGETIIITLTGDTWAATVGANNAITTALIAGIDSAQSETNGWDAEVKGNMTYAEITRTSDTVVTITLAA
ncbi:MAG: hypothetical protein GY861_14395, partial [bacterium]|nr:hypothetical protein [bacterium]